MRCLLPVISKSVCVLGVAMIIIASTQQQLKAADSQERLTLTDSIELFERQLGVKSDSGNPLPDRLSSVEKMMFGGPQSGPLLNRVIHVRRALEPPALPTESPMLQQELSSSANIMGDSLPLLNAIPANFLRIEPPSAAAAKFKSADDYFAEVLKTSKGKIIRFKAMPVPVYVNSFPDSHFLSCVVQGFKIWEDRTGGCIRFVQVDEPDKARIQVAWKRLGAGEDKTGCLLGAHTVLKYSANSGGSVSLLNVGAVPVPVYIPKFGPKYTVPPQVIEVNLDMIMQKSAFIRYRLLQNVITHELGHALGVLGHSKNACDIMYSVTDEHSRMSDRDVNTVKKLYKQKTQVPL